MARILVVDDEYPLRELLRTILDSQGYEVETAESGQQALEMLRKGRFDLVFLDMNMPGMTGTETVRIMRSDTKLQNIPVVMCTSVSVTRVVEEAYAAGANAYIVKSMMDSKKVAEKARSLLGR